MKKNIAIPFTFIFLLVLILQLTINQISHAEAEKSQNKPDISSNITWLTFSSTKYSHERNLVKEHMRMTAYERYERSLAQKSGRKSSFDTGRIFIALADLNDDGVKEIFSYINISNYCGQQTGCPLNIYRIKSGKLISLFRPEFIRGFPMFLEIDNAGKQQGIGILPSKTMGWRDIALKGGTVWKWNGKDYGYRGNQ